MLTFLILYQSILFAFPKNELSGNENRFELFPRSQSEVILCDYEGGQLYQVNFRRKSVQPFSSFQDGSQSIANFALDADQNSFLRNTYSTEFIKLNSDFEELYRINLKDALLDISDIIILENQLLFFDSTENTLFVYDLRLNKVIKKVSSQSYPKLNFTAAHRFIKHSEGFTLLDQDKLHYFDRFARFLFSKTANDFLLNTKIERLLNFFESPESIYLLDDQNRLFKNGKLLYTGILDFLATTNSLLVLNRDFEFFQIKL